MTRESKIGLLVGLSFIIAVGILLSDHLSTADEPTPASLQLAGSAVRSSLGQASGDPVVVPVGLVGVPRSIAPARPVALPGELAAARARRAKPQSAAQVAAIVAPPVADAQVPDTAMAFVPTPMAVVPPSANPDLIAAAERAGQPLVPANAAPGAASAGRTVMAEPGDSLGSLAERAYGSNTRSTRTALLAANPTLKADPSRIVAGRSYAVGGDAPAAPAATPASKSLAAAGTVWYTVKAGDTLWSIAGGSSRAVAAIRELNRDVLHDDKLHLNMRLKMPKSKAD
jgi:nucleoid-associated protein YgaU